MQAVKQAMSIDTLFLIITSSAYCGLNVLLNDYNAFLFGSNTGQRNLGVPLFFTLLNFTLAAVVWTTVLILVGPAECATPDMVRASCSHWAR